MRVLKSVARAFGRSVRVSFFAPALAALAALLLSSRPCAATESQGDPQPREEEEFGIEVIDAKAFGPKKNPPRITIDPPVGEVDPSALRRGVFADGTSVLVIRLTPVDWAGGNVTFEVTHTNADPAFPQATDYVGSLSTAFPTLPAPDAAAGVRRATLLNGNKLCYYRPPNNYHFGYGSLTQALRITATSGGNVLATASIDLVRPTIFLVHGVMAAGGFMNPAYDALTTDGRQADVKFVDYWACCTSGYETTTVRLRNVIAADILGENSGATARVGAPTNHPGVSWCPIVGIAAPTKTFDDVTGRWKLLADLAGIDPADVGLTPQNSDIFVRDISQVDRRGGPFPPAGLKHHKIQGIWHNEVVGPPVHNALRIRLDLRFEKPTDDDYDPGHSRFNPSF